MTPAAALRHTWLRRRLPRPPGEKEEWRTATDSPHTSKSNTLIGSSRSHVLRVNLNDDRSATLHSTHSGRLPPVA